MVRSVTSAPGQQQLSLPTQPQPQRLVVASSQPQQQQILRAGGNSINRVFFSTNFSIILGLITTS